MSAECLGALKTFFINTFTSSASPSLTPFCIVFEMCYELSFYKSFLMSKFSGTFHKLQQELTNQHLPHVGITPITREKDVMSSKLLSTKLLNVNIFRHFSQKARVCLTLASLGLHWKKMDCVEICVIWQLLCPKPMFYSKLSNFPP